VVVVAAVAVVVVAAVAVAVAAIVAVVAAAAVEAWGRGCWRGKRPTQTLLRAHRRCWTTIIRSPASPLLR
jgi:hypothetical protein